MASIDSGVETGNESNDDPKLDPMAEPRVEQMALVPVQGPLRDPDEATTSDVFTYSPVPVSKLYLLHPLDGQNLDIDPPSGLSFPNLQGTNLSPGLGYSVFPSESSPLVHQEMRRERVLARDEGSGVGLLRNSREFFVVRRLGCRIRRHRMQVHGPLMERKLRVAVSSNNIELVQHLLFMGVNPNCFDTQRRAPLHLAACRGYSDIVRLLLENGADPNQRDSLGNTPLHLAACTNNIVVVTLLLKAGTDVSLSDYCGRSPLQIAQAKLRLLQAHFGSDVSVHIKNQVYQVIDMMLEFLHKRGQDSEAELLSAFSSRLTLSETKEQVETQVRDLLESLSGLSIDNNSNRKDSISNSSGNSSSSSSSSTSSSSSSSGSSGSSSSSGGGCAGGMNAFAMQRFTRPSPAFKEAKKDLDSLKSLIFTCRNSNTLNNNNPIPANISSTSSSTSSSSIGSSSNNSANNSTKIVCTQYPEQKYDRFHPYL